MSEVDQQGAQPTTDERGWRPIATAPKDKPILGWCVHGADPYHLEEGLLTTYGAHAEGLGHVDDGPHVLVWGGEYHENDWESQINCHIPAWWFDAYSNFERTANPTHWQPIPEAPL